MNEPLHLHAAFEEEQPESLIRQIAAEVIAQRARFDPVSSVSFSVANEVCRLTPIYGEDDELVRIELKYGDEYRRYNRESTDWEIVKLLLLLVDEKLRPTT